VETGTASAAYAGTATLEAENEATVVARVSGVVESVFVEAGDAVQKGAALAKLDDERLELELKRANVQLRKLESIHQRMERMRQKQLVSEEEYEQARSEYEAQEVARDLARLQVQRTTIRAPFRGLVSDRMVKVGNMIGANSPAFQVTDFDPLWAVMNVPERAVQSLEQGQTATLRLDAVPGRTFEGRVHLISPVVDPESGTFRVVVEIRDPSRTAKPGMFGRVRIQYDAHENARLIPKSAVVEEDDETTVFVVQDTIAVRRPVATGYTAGDRIEIVDGISMGDRVVVSGQAALRDSARVDVVR
jgi:RND family efflux transporter MFP subunit